MSRHFHKLFIVLLIMFFSISIVKADVILPAPQTKDGMGIFEALKKRSSTPGGAFGVEKISDEELSTVLWAASGLNRGKNGWTVPMSKGKAPYVRIYVASANGVFLYQWDGHYLQEIGKSDIRGDIALQNFTKRAAYSFIFVTDNQALSDFNDSDKANNFSQIALGAMSQNIYLAATALKLNVRYISSIKPEIISDELHLTNGDHAIGLMLLGK